jgi:hypothetical protein
MDPVQVFQGLLTPVIAFIAVYIAWQQWKANERRLMLDLYDRRFRVYQRVVDFLLLVQREFRPEVQDVSRYYAETSEATFLFGPEIPAYIREVAKHALDLYVANKEYCDMTRVPPPGYDHAKVCNAMHTAERWLAEQTQGDESIVVEKFRKYLDISR